MLPTFVIGLREGLEAALIVGIIAAFLTQQGRRDLLRWAFVGVGGAVVLCASAGVALQLVSRNLPQRQQEGLETVVGVLAVVMVTYMIVWMRRHSRDLLGQLQSAAADAMASGSGLALVAMAFLAVLREGLETVVFLLAAFNESSNAAQSGGGAALGIVVAVILGYGIYRGGVRINLSKFFRATGLVLALVAAGLVVTALHTAHEAGWLNAGQQQTVDLSWLVGSGSVQSSLLTGMLGLQPRPVLIEVIGWLVYLVPVALYVSGGVGRLRTRSRVAVARTAAALGALAVAAAVLLAVLAPDRRAVGAFTSDGTSAQLISRSGAQAVLRATAPALGSAPTALGRPAGGDLREIALTRTGDELHSALPTDVYTATVTGPAAGATTMTYDELAAANGGRLPLGLGAVSGMGAMSGLGAASGSTVVPVSHAGVSSVTVWADPRTGRIVDLRWQERVTLIAQLSIGATPIGVPTTATAAPPPADVRIAVTLARQDADLLDRGRSLRALALVLVLAGFAVLALALAAASVVAANAGRAVRPRPAEDTPAVKAAPEPVGD